MVSISPSATFSAGMKRNSCGRGELSSSPRQFHARAVPGNEKATAFCGLLAAATKRSSFVVGRTDAFRDSECGVGAGRR
jgi:hypothetical protein